VRKRLLLMVFLVACLSCLSAEEQRHETASEQNTTFYAGINPMALFAFLPRGYGTFTTGFGSASNQEFGISLYGGMYFAKAHSLELRFSTGLADAVVRNTQLQFGYIWYPFEQFMNWNGGLSTGLMLRQFFWYNRITDYVTFNLTPELLLGWRFKVKSCVFDTRAGWDFASVTWSNMPHTKAGTGWIPFPYNVTFTAGIAWLF